MPSLKDSTTPPLAIRFLRALLRYLRALRDRRRRLRVPTHADVIAAIAATAAGPWTVGEAQTALAEAARGIAAIMDVLDEIHAGLPEPSDINDRQEGRKPYDRATDILATIECVQEDSLRPALEALRRSAAITDADLAAHWRDQRKRWERS